jgi:hypothetical protein
MTDTTEKVVLPRESADGFAHLRQSRDAAHIRFYLWLYDAREDTINTCKLFWAYVFAPIVLLLRAGWVVVGPIAEYIADKAYERELRKTREELLAEEEPDEQPKVSTAEGALDKVSGFLSGVYAKFAPVLKWIGIVLGGLLALVLAASLVVAFIAEPLKVAITLGSIVAIFIIVGLIIWAAEERKGGGFFSFFGKLAKGFHRHTCAKIDLD